MPNYPCALDAVVGDGALRAAIADNGGQVFNVASFLSATDPDYTNASLTAVAEANRVGGQVLYPPSTRPYQVAAGLTLTAGAGITAYGAVLQPTASISNMVLVQGTGHLIEGLTFDGNTTLATIALNPGQSSKCRIRDCTFQNIKTGISFANVTDLDIEDCNFTNWTIRAIYPVLSSVSGQRIKIDGCVIENYTGTSGVAEPIWFDSSGSARWQDVKILNNKIFGPGVAFASNGTSDQIHVQHGDDIQVQGNTSVGGGDEGMSFEDITEITVVGNICRLNQTSGLNLGSASATGCKGGAVAGNVFVDNNQNAAAGGAAINLSYCTDVVSGHNRLGNDTSNKTLYGYYVFHGTDVTVGPDDYATCSSGYIESGGSNTGCLEVLGSAFS